jgi:hypothetical protein
MRVVVAGLRWQYTHGRATILELFPHDVVHVLVGEISHVDGSATHPHFRESIAMVVPDVVVVLRFGYAQSVNQKSKEARIHLPWMNPTRPRAKQMRMWRRTRMLSKRY